MADSLNPQFADRLTALQSLLRDQYGLNTSVSSGLRDNNTQATLYAQGRTAPGPVVTNAPPGSSYHNYGAAADLTPTNMDQAAAEKILGRAFQENPDTGLTWGGTFKSIHDPFHVQLGTSLQALRDPTPVTQSPGAAAVAPAGSAPVAPASGMLAGADLSSSQQQASPDLGALVQRALAMTHPQTPQVPPLTPMKMPIPPGLRARLQSAAIGQG